MNLDQEAYESFRTFDLLLNPAPVSLNKGLDRLPKTLTFPMTKTLSGQSDQKLGSSAGRVNSFMVSSVGFQFVIVVTPLTSI